MSYILEDSWTTEAGLRATVLFVNESHRCGYIEVNEIYPDYANFNYHDKKVHGNITYVGSPIIKETTNVNAWWIGFDCAQEGDGTKYFPELPVRTLEYVKKECESLAKELAKLEQGVV